MKPVIRIAETNEPYEAEWIEPELGHLEEAEKKWVPVLKGVSVELFASTGQFLKRWQGQGWIKKEPYLSSSDHRLVGVLADGSVQGLAKFDIVGQVSHKDKSTSIVYIDYLEAAPWNVKSYMDLVGHEQKYKDVGTELIKRAIRISDELGFGGAIGLHSIESAKDFYRRIGMEEVGADANKGNMVVFEFSAEDAQRFLETNGHETNGKAD